MLSIHRPAPVPAHLAWSLIGLLALAPAGCLQPPELAFDNPCDPKVDQGACGAVLGGACSLAVPCSTGPCVGMGADGVGYCTQPCDDARPCPSDYFCLPSRFGDEPGRCVNLLDAGMVEGMADAVAADARVADGGIVDAGVPDGGVPNEVEVDCPTACATITDSFCYDAANCPDGHRETALLDAACTQACEAGWLDARAVWDEPTCEGALEMVFSASAEAVRLCGRPDRGGGACTAGQSAGVCIDPDVADCEANNGTPVGDACPGGGDVVCCLDYPCTTDDGLTGLCFDQALCDTEVRLGLCPGHADIGCCLDVE